MKKFVKKLGLFSLIVILLIFLLSTEIEEKNYISDYMSAMNDKHGRLDRIAGPRIIFVGGSGTSFGVDTKKIEQELNIPATNLALVAGLGLDFMLNEIEAKMRKGDIVILSSEYYLGVDGNYELKVYTAKCCSDASGYFEQDYIENFTSVRFKYIKNNFNYAVKYLLHGNQPALDTSTDYTAAFTHRTDFDEYGDMVGHIGKRPPPKLDYMDYIPYSYYEGIKRINEFYEKARKINVKVYFVYNAYAKSAYQLNRETIQRYHADFVRDMHIPILGKPADFIYEDSLFFDTTFHLDLEGRELRTQELIRLLKSVPINKAE